MSMKTLSLAGLAGIAALGAQAQVPGSTLPVVPSQSLVVTATRQSQPAVSLRDAIVITREELDASGALSLGEVLERRAGIQLRATGGPGQPQGLFVRGAGTAQTLVLVDGLRVSSATVGTTSIENIPLELIERIEVVKGPLSSLYGSEAIGGVVQVFTRGKSAPHLFGSVAYGTQNDRRASAGLATVDERNNLALSAGARKVDAPSATNPRAFCHDPDRDPHENYFANLHAGHRLWQDELISIDAFATHGRTAFDCGPGDRNDQTIGGVKLTSANNIISWWASRFSVGHGRDKLVTRGSFPGRFETMQDQASWVNEFKVPAGSLLVGLEGLRQKIRTDETQGVFARRERETRSAFVGLNEAWGSQRLEASVRHDDDDSFGKRTTGSASYGIEWGTWGRLSATVAKGFRAPTFFDLYGPTITSEFGGFASVVYQANPLLKPERSESREISWRSGGGGAQWRITAFDNRIDDLITYVFPTVLNVEHARIRGVEASIDANWWSTRWHASITAQKPRNEDTGRRLQGRAETLASLSAERDFGKWTVGGSVLAVGNRHDSTTEDPAMRLPSHAVVDARVRYRFEKFWSVELAATNLADKRYETAVGYNAPRRSVLLGVRFDAF
jgi:vitamin B12 transporter